MVLAGDVSIHDCSISASEQGLALKLYDMLCADSPHVDAGEWTGEELYAQRAEEIGIINDTLLANGRNRDFDYDAFPEDSFVIIDCPSASGGICVVNDWGGHFIQLTTFKLGERYFRDERWIAADCAKSMLSPPGEGNGEEICRPHEMIPATHEGQFDQDIMKAMDQIRSSRAVFDNPERVKKAAEIVNGALSIFIDLLLLPFRYFLYD